MKAWEEAHQFALLVYRRTEKFPLAEAFGITSQLRRPALSVPTNLVEGQASSSRRDFKNFVNIARRSLAETEYLPEFSREIGYLPGEVYNEIEAQREKWAFSSTASSNPFDTTATIATIETFATFATSPMMSNHAYSVPRVLFWLGVIALVLGLGSQLGAPDDRVANPADIPKPFFRSAPDEPVEEKVSARFRSWAEALGLTVMLGEGEVSGEAGGQDEPQRVLSSSPYPRPDAAYVELDPPSGFFGTALPTDPEREREDPATEVFWQEMRLGETRSVGEVRVRFWAEPERPVAGEPVQLSYEVLDIKTGQPVKLWTNIHYTAMHNYLTRADLSGDVMHLHFSEPSPGVRSESVSFPTGGTWHSFAQFSTGRTAYMILSVIDVDGDRGTAFAPDFSRVRTLDDTWEVTMQLSHDPVRANQPVVVTFDAVPLPNANAPKLESSILDGGHNVILALENALMLWNTHGDRSVELIGPAVGFPHHRHDVAEHPFRYDFTFTKPGLWLLHVEIQSQPVRFYLRVEP